jgi:hypothetical protein
MKTPREIILEHHRSADAELDRIRPETLAACVQESVAPHGHAIAHAAGWCYHAAGGLWHEALWPWRRAWIGLAVVWLILSALNLTTEAPPTRAEYKMRAPNADTLAAARDQRRLIMQWLEPIEPLTDSQPSTPSPRSESIRKPCTA